MAQQAVEKKLTDDEAKEKEKLKWLKRSSEAFKSLSDATKNLSEFRTNPDLRPENHKKNLLRAIDKAYKVDKLLTETEYKDMKKEIGDTASYDEDALKGIKRKIQEKEEEIIRAEEKAKQNVSKTKKIRMETKKYFRLSIGLKSKLLFLFCLHKC